MTITVSFDRVGHLVRVPVQFGRDQYRFLVDTGIGVTVVSSLLAERYDVHRTGETFTAKRMSGQALDLPLVRLPEARIGDYVLEGHVAAIADLGTAEGPEGFDGILGPGFFADYAVTTNPDAMSLTVRPAVDVVVDGHLIPLEIRRDRISLDPFVALVLPSGREIQVEVDTGSANLILDLRFLDDCGVATTDAAVTTKTGTDETGFEWTRHWCTIPGSVHLAAAPQTAQDQPRVQFQSIVHDGLIGTDYLERYLITFDVSGARLILGPRNS